MPINEINDVGFFAKSFPTLFLYGVGDYTLPRIRKISLKEWAKYLLDYFDGNSWPFRNHPQLSYYLLNIIQRNQARSNTSICIKKNGLLTNINDISSFAKLMNDNPNLLNSMTPYNQNIRGTSAYWKKL